MTVTYGPQYLTDHDEYSQAIRIVASPNLEIYEAKNI
jgi:hypothetical protein